MKSKIDGMPAFLLLLAMYAILACNSEPGKKTAPEQGAANAEVYKQVSPEFNADTAYHFVQTQVDFGPRVNNTPSHKKCGDWMVNELKRQGAEVFEQKTVIPFNGKNLEARNIIGSFNPKATKRILLGAHWDSRPYADKDETRKTEPIPGANDGASGVAVLLEIARVLKNNPLDIGIDIIFFDAEDLGLEKKQNSYCLGSQYWSTHIHSPSYRADYGILLDMVGGINPFFGWEQNSTENAKPIVEKVWGIAQKLNYSKYFVYYQYGGIEDDHAYVIRNAGIPMIDIIDYNPMQVPGTFPPYHHTHRDNMSIIDRNTLKAVGQTVLEVIYSEKAPS